MQNFYEFAIQPYLDKINPKHIIEIGAERGLNTNKILTYCENNDCKLTSIDPFPIFDFNLLKNKYNEKFDMVCDLSLNVLSKLEPCDIAMIDGDHNWYTVYNELKSIELINLSNNHSFPIVFFHDIGWPYARRDMYYNPDNIPKEFQQPYKKEGIMLDLDELTGSSRRGMNPNVANAIHEGGAKNGVLTAVEDFIKESKLNLVLHLIHGQHGFGVLFEDTEFNKSIFDFHNIQTKAATLAEYGRLNYMIQLIDLKAKLEEEEEKNNKRWWKRFFEI